MFSHLHCGANSFSREAGTEACLPYLVHILDQAAMLLGMHIVVFMSGKTLGAGVLIIV